MPELKVEKAIVFQASLALLLLTREKLALPRRQYKKLPDP
jgi:hypothetical protein